MSPSEKLSKFWRRVPAAAAIGALTAASILAGPGLAGAASIPAPKLAFSPPTGDYGQVIVGQTASQDFTLANQGGSASGALTVTLSGSAAFTILADTCSAISLGPGKSCTISVQFAPAGPGADSATLTAAGKRADTATTSLTGTGVVPGHLYWANQDAGTIVKAASDGSNLQVIATSEGQPRAVAVDSANLYWTRMAGTIVEAGLDGSNPQVIATGQAAPNGMAVDGTHLYWSSGYNGTIVEAGLDGSNPQVIVTGQLAPFGVAVDSTHLDWADFTAGTIVEAGLDGSNPQVIATGQFGPVGVAVDSAHLFWTSYGAGTIVEAGLDGSNPHAIVTGQDGPSGLAFGTP